MSVPRFHCPLPLAAGACLSLPERVSHHAIKVLRLRSGSALTLFNGEGGEYGARILAVDGSRANVEILDRRAVERESPLAITLIQALQAGEKMDLTVQKAVELGVTRIVPALSRRSVVRLDASRAIRRTDHWRGVVAAACEQCGRNRLPAVDDPVSLEDWLTRSPPSAALRLLLEPTASQSLKTLPSPPEGSVELLIGAESGLAPEEIRLAESVGFRPIRFGPRVLRTETAGMAALAAIQFFWGDF
ncbi:MAG TPA: 16S rRNA (uracil(1498)-N(3))-methyltransferase [Accumulibacter sp.]|nr:16S rRNA (uracil(1498)-N(3))-methyltransferase [Accumulibacter sp.]HMW17981.1 16S rRNA (uracil(1498)-N(3))-methyltransferase [Accumulibacter sp.]HMX22392.1 16S rRNA (uracil(1498)-N(3))-methyltransferase [Accumulibacter sp.]HMY05816.1 16S rRNA (uracil(1498)-N(3))-methyltransferase [Accumulibacter sp.]HNC18078.1 16S rRNA (uracil(1498)-N(3))-methyltransferase [Accumulibacter sp.]